MSGARADPRRARPARREVLPTDFRLTFTDGDFKWAGETRPGLPVLQWPDGSLCEPVAAFFGYSTEISRVTRGSMVDEAYAIREWLAYLGSRGVPWNEPSDRLLREWREDHRRRRETEDGSRNGRRSAETTKQPATGGTRPVSRRVAGSERVERKISCVFTFYRLLPNAYRLGEDLRPYPPFVGDENARGRRITGTTRVDRRGKVSQAWFGASAAGPNTTRRSTPTPENVARILTGLRSGSQRKPTRRMTIEARSEQVMQCDQDWLQARCMTEAGLRREEVADLSLDTILKALRDNGIAVDWPVTPDGVHPLDQAGRDDQRMQAVLSALAAMKRRYRRNLFVEVVGKGRKARKARKVPFPIDLVADLLQIGVWGVRKRRIIAWAARDHGYSAPWLVFLSTKTKRAMLPKSIGDLVTAAFRAAGVDGSAHRLRAFFATSLAVRLLEERVAQNGFRLDRSVRMWVIERVAEALGHEDEATTVRHYVSLAELEFFSSNNRRKLKGLSLLWDTLLAHAPSLSSLQQGLVARLVKLLGASGNGSELEQILSIALREAEASLGQLPVEHPVRVAIPKLTLVGGTAVSSESDPT